MSDESLLERIRRLESEPEGSETQIVSRRSRSVLNHLQRMLNTRQGSVPIAQDYGLPDLTNFPEESLQGTAKNIERALSQVLMKYEPRLAKVRIQFETKAGQNLILRFRLEAEMIDPREPGKSIPIAFETLVSPGGMISVEG